MLLETYTTKGNEDISACLPPFLNLGKVGNHLIILLLCNSSKPIIIINLFNALIEFKARDG